MSDTRKLVACLRCRSRKSKCPGRTDSQGCLRCVNAGVACEVVPHNRGRKHGTKLSEEARAGIREKYAARSQHVSTGDKRKRTDEEDNIGSSGSHDTRKGEVAGRPNPLASNLHAKPANRNPLDLGRLPTSSVRVNSETQAAIGPTSNRTTSIARLFTPKRTDRTKQSGLSLYRDDPITCGYLTEAMAKDLFAFFMQRLADRLFIFDVFLHTYEYVRDSSTFLFCAILATAARFSPVTISQVTQQRCLALAKDHMLKVFSDNDKTEETIQALYILTEYKDNEDEDGYLLLGMACRIALDIGLSQPRPELSERENRSRTRIWLVLYCADRRFNYCGQTAKPCMMPENESVCACKDFVKSHLCLAIDHRIADNVALRRQLAAQIEAIDADVDCHLDLRQEYYTMEEKATEWEADQISTEPDTPHHAHLAALLARVVIAHRWVHRSFRDDSSSRNFDAREKERREALAVCIQGSLGILETLRQISLDTLRYGSDSKHLYFAYGSFFLQKVFDTQIAVIMLDRPSIAYILTLLQECSQRLEEASAYPASTAAFHASFLRHLMASCEQVMQQVTDLASDLSTTSGHTSQVAEPNGDIERPPMVNTSSNRAFPEETSLVHPPVSLQGSAHVFEDQPVLRPTFDMLLGSLNDETLGESVIWDDWWPLNDIWGSSSSNNNIHSGFQ